MGKPYVKELEKLSEVYDWATKTPIDELSKFVKRFPSSSLNGAYIKRTYPP